MATVVTFMQSLGARLMVQLAGRHGVAWVLGSTLGLAVIGAVATNPAVAGTPSRPATVQPNATVASQPSHHCDGDW